MIITGRRFRESLTASEILIDAANNADRVETCIVIVRWKGEEDVVVGWPSNENYLEFFGMLEAARVRMSKTYLEDDDE